MRTIAEAVDTALRQPDPVAWLKRQLLFPWQKTHALQDIQTAAKVGTMPRATPPSGAMERGKGPFLTEAANLRH